MSHLIALAFDEPDQARSVRDHLLQLDKQHLVDLEDACVVVHEDGGRVKLEQTIDLTTQGALGGAFWGTLIGLFFLQPLVGMGVGMISGALAGSHTDVGIDDDFMEELGESLPEGGSALFVLLRRATLDKVLEELRPLNGRVLHTSLSVEDEARLRAMTAEAQARPPAPAPNRQSTLGPDAAPAPA